MDVLATNLETLSKMNFYELTNRVNIRKSGDFLVIYLTIMIDKDSGEILDIRETVRCFDNMATAIVAFKRKSLMDPHYQLELMENKNNPWSPEVKSIIETSLQNFNDSRS